MNLTGQWQVAANPCVKNALHALNFPHPSDAAKFLQCGQYERIVPLESSTTRRLPPALHQRQAKRLPTIIAYKKTGLNMTVGNAIYYSCSFPRNK
ncbi:hypothetical protein MAR_010652 [Mya arenaria]|uniref:Uncharacterized protein n=1 Tax=Mya arenaria TaxID=6604 RepID=A0ABY7FRU7_MYAAR|nr:hypothetical protein MAR_010652 [Mya arenaria]